MHLAKVVFAMSGGVSQEPQKVWKVRSNLYNFGTLESFLSGILKKKDIAKIPGESSRNTFQATYLESVDLHGAAGGEQLFAWARRKSAADPR